MTSLTGPYVLPVPITLPIWAASIRQTHCKDAHKSATARSALTTRSQTLLARWKRTAAATTKALPACCFHRGSKASRRSGATARFTLPGTALGDGARLIAAAGLAVAGGACAAGADAGGSGGSGGGVRELLFLVPTEYGVRLFVYVWLGKAELERDAHACSRRLYACEI
jgi:hypothetical protein